MLLYSSFAAGCIRRAHVVCYERKSHAYDARAAPKRLHQSSQRQRAHSKSIKIPDEANTKSVRPLTSDGTGHHDLESYLAFADREGLDTTTTVYRGTVFEYSVARALGSFGMVLERVGKANDMGIDLLGQWQLPELTALPVLLQCKVSKALPQVVRELEGACSSAPAKWSGSRRLAILASQHQASPGVIQALQKSPSSLGFVQVDLNGLVKQFLWNANAAEQSLSGLGVTTKHIGSVPIDSMRSRPAIDQSSIALTWKGKPWRVKGDQKQRS